MIDVKQVTQLHRETVDRWHQRPVDNPFDDAPWNIICQQHSFNFLLWHEEDIARSPDVGDTRVAEVKRAIDGYNQNRNDWIEKIDDWISTSLSENGIEPQPGAPLNTETPGSVIDRLSILALRMYHLDEQTERSDATPQHIESVERKIAVCLLQHEDLSTALEQLLDDISTGRKRHRTYRQFKMYNDPALNPYLYQAKQRLAG